MKQKIAMIIIILAMMPLYSYISAASADDNLAEPKMQNITDFTYHAGTGDSRETAIALARYGAKQKAVLFSAKQLASRGLLSNSGDKERAIVCLVAVDLQFSIIAESFSEKNNSYTTKISSTVSLSEFVKAEMKNSTLEKTDTHLSLQDEMDPVMSEAIEPAEELSKAYRYIGKKHWRMAVIYLDRLEKKYPYWGELFFAKALGFQGVHETDKVKQALSSACNYGSHEACEKLETIK
jgi:hypothetical protein